MWLIIGGVVAVILAIVIGVSVAQAQKASNSTNNSGGGGIITNLSSNNTNGNKKLNFNPIYDERDNIQDRIQNESKAPFAKQSNYGSSGINHYDTIVEEDDDDDEDGKDDDNNYNKTCCDGSHMNGGHDGGSMTHDHSHDHSESS